jgi:hypothetical protein
LVLFFRKERLFLKKKKQTDFYVLAFIGGAARFAQATDSG